MKKRLIVIDGNALVHRAFHALPPLKTKKGELVNGVYGFFLIFLKAIRELKPDFIAVTFDLPGKTFRHKKYKEYKAKRPKAPEELYLQIPKVKELLKIFNIPVFEKEGFEADDVIGTITKKAPQKQVFPEIESIILTGDLDTLQLVDKNTKVYTLRKGFRDTVIYDEEKVKERYQLLPSQLLDFKALKGDPSDNIPGVPQIGEKRAIELLKEFGSLENIYKEIEETKKIEARFKKILKDYEEQAYFSKSLAEIRTDVPIEFNLKDCAFKDYDREKVKKAFEDLGFHSLIRQLPGSTLERTLIEEKMEKGGVLQLIEELYKGGIFSKKIYEIEKNLVPVVKKMEEAGIKVEKEALKNLSRRLDKKILNLQEKIYNLAGIKFNINSPKQLSEVLFEKLNLSSEGLKRTPGGEISTAWSELKKIREEHKIIDLVGEYREIFKLKSSFLDPLPTFIGEDGRIHPKFHQLGTETGRFSCSNPNLQNVPIRGELGKTIRKCFVAPEGFKLVSFDYSQMELKIAASLANDKKLIKFFKEGKDIHKMTAVEILNIPEEKVTEKMRDLAKRLNFGVLYGMGAGSLAEIVKIPLKEAQNFIREYFKKFKGIAEFEKKSVKTVKEKGFSKTIFGRKRMLPEIKSRDLRIRSSAERMAKNLPIQGSSADIMKMAMIKINKQLAINNEQCRMVLQIHDELLFEIKEEKVLKIAKEIKKIMESVVELKVPLEVEIKIGDNWGELKNLKKFNF